MPVKREPVFYLDLLRSVAAIAVIIIHVLGPYRTQFGEIPDDEWLTAVGFNSLTRWCVPVFIMISGMLFMSDSRPFQLGYFIKRRAAKVIVPFLAWATFYALFSGLTPSFSYQWTVAVETLQNLPYEHSWYHLGFYYYFIPLYFVTCFMAPVVQAASRDKLKFAALIWLWLTLSYLIRLNTFWHQDIFLYGGYLIWGYCLSQWDTRKYQSLIVAGGIIGVIMTFWGVVSLSLEKGTYSVGRFNSYKTINVVLVSTMVFCLAKHYADRIEGTFRVLVSFISRYSLGLFLVHPLFLWPVRAYDLYWGHPAWMIPLWTVINTAVTLLAVWLMSLSRWTRWLVP